MAKTIKFILTIAASLMALGIIIAVNAQEPATSADDQVQKLEPQEISAEELEVKDQKFLPDNPFYFLKEWTRNIKMAFTFNEIKKVELENKFANEKLIELKKLTENGINSEKIKKATENYQNAMDKIKEIKGCKELWWFDKNNRVCQQKEFCGAYMYLGLKTFSTQSECQNSLNSSANSLTPQTGQ